MTDDEIAERVHDAANALNHWSHVARHAGLTIQWQAAPDRVRMIGGLCVARVLGPAQTVTVFLTPEHP